jgi:DNA polymerase-1
MKTLLLIDGNAIMHRAFHALPPMNSNDGTPTNMTYGFFTIISKVISDIKPDYLIVCFDTPKPTFRQELLEEYQAHRPHAPDEFKVQIPYIRSLLDAAGIARLEKDGFEADDVIGSLATRFKNEAKIYILTGDKDIMQLVNGNITVITPQIGFSKSNLYTPDEVQKKLGVLPEQIPDYKALAGDPSDNYKGVKGVGPKTASELIRKFGTVENLLEKLSNVENEKLRLNLENHRDVITLTKKIATIVKDIDFTKTLEEYRFTTFKSDMKPKLMELQLYSLVKKFFPQELEVKPKKEKQPEKDDSQMGMF